MHTSKNKGFTLAEMMVVMLILTIVLAAFAPLMTKRKTVDLTSPWKYATNNSDIYFGLASTQSAMIGQNAKTDTDLGARLIISNNTATQPLMTFKNGNTNLAQLIIKGTNFVLGGPYTDSFSSSVTYNTAFGYKALLNSSGNNNTAIGGDALNAVTSGAQNTAVGVRTAPNLTTGNYNTAIGYNACKNITANSQFRTCIGSGSQIPSTYLSDNSKQVIALGAPSTEYGANAIVYVPSGGTIKIGTATVLTDASSSDRRLKNIKGTNKKGLEQIRNLQVYDYVFKKDDEKKLHVGLMAQDVKASIPEAVETDENGFLMIKKENIFYAMFNAVKQLDTLVQGLIGELKMALIKLNSHDEEIKQLRKENTELKQQFKNLEKENSEIKQRIEKLETRM